MWYVYTMDYYSAIQKNETVLFATIWMQLEIIIQSEVRKRKTNTTQCHLPVNLKYGTNETVYKTADSQT